ncbi:MAG TPA: DEAD/DEAH box helicase [Candidatus Nanoarchaeia archaeon]|nr:DEAD/DEAH box helicase [Candidatus Nanoarchaeia archaeon]
MDFIELKVKEEIVRALAEMNIIEPTEIQAKTIPEIKKGSDIIGVSKTGSGKTIAFGVTLMDHIKLGHGIQALVVVPVRELAEQVANEIRKLSKYIRPNVTIIYGGVSLSPQEYNLRRADIVVGTPGRLLDHLNRGSINLSKIKIVILDEADKMATMGFIEDVEKILRATPKTRQTLLFGATISNDIAMLRDRYMKNPVVIKGTAHVHESVLNQFYYDVDMREKFSFLVHLLNKEKPKLAIVFCSTRRNADNVARNLQVQSVDAHVIHGGMSQPGRLRVIEGFHRGKPHILVATAVAARGLDIKGVTHIFNYDVPKNPEEYIHQIGRTARAGASGKAITLLSGNDHDNFSAVLRKYPVKVTKLPRESFARVPFDSGKRFVSENRFGNRGRFGHSGGSSSGRFGNRSDMSHGDRDRRHDDRPRRRFNF